ncbi:hypothetical protein PCANC_06672 [Puccinia coronata f. sp. avenae]|uniref:ER membrane protein complex subunit 2 n=1 Tax=Puccinia coronata f. sp. avenae TaxID=200324 RepID=A0A2N5SE93_9BASI|nr:hypothetical protein PCANC_23145 [Puccinia coronata f. sp. avenae]PLW11505.1 hypothetical protein PCASD_22642 [Puccinia coronata f. sp. avenae]PLW38294.1 hypothetical protein PCASD_08984 [Puccinia coronata f. sp. avenae]PLW53558.1 hypothetical protein PCANC_06672 [Puccinia coronata f. sp. avenae]
MKEAVSLSQATDRLKVLRDSGVRQSQEVVQLAKVMLGASGRVSRLGDDLWTVYEQIAVAALDIGNLQIAKTTIQRLETKFPNSARVTVLHGMFLEAQGDLLGAKSFYEHELEKKFNPKNAELGSVGELNIRVRKRLIALHLHHSPPPYSQDSKSSSSPSTSPFSLHTGIQLLVDHLDIVYSDPEGWLQLADAYASLGLYEQSLSALEDLILIQPENTFHILRYAETAYTAGEYELSYKTYLRVIELSDRISSESKGGPCRRAALGLKMCIQRLPKTSTRQEIEKMIDRELEACYSQDWVPLQAGLRVASEPCRKTLKSFLAQHSSSS